MLYFQDNALSDSPYIPHILVQLGSWVRSSSQTLTFTKVRCQSQEDRATTTLLQTFIHYSDGPVSERTSLKKMYCRVVWGWVVNADQNTSFQRVIR